MQAEMAAKAEARAKRAAAASITKQTGEVATSPIKTLAKPALNPMQQMQAELAAKAEARAKRAAATKNASGVATSPIKTPAKPATKTAAKPALNPMQAMQAEMAVKAEARAKRAAAKA